MLPDPHVHRMIAAERVALLRADYGRLSVSRSRRGLHRQASLQPPAWLQKPSAARPRSTRA